MLEKLESIDSGSNYNFNSQLQKPNNPRSAFDLSHLVTTTVPNAGTVYPLDWMLTLPGDDFDISVDALLRVLPQVVPLYSRQRMYIYAFHNRLSDLYDNFQVLATKGWSGTVAKTLPTLNENNLAGVDSDKILPDSLGDFFGLPQGITRGQFKDSVSHALPAMHHLRVWRDYFCNKDYYINDRIILPDDDSRFRLGDDGNLLSAKDLGKTVKFDLFSAQNKHIYYDAGGNLVVGLFNHDYPNDRFTSAKPFTQRGDEAKLELHPNINFDELFFTYPHENVTNIQNAVQNDGGYGVLMNYYDDNGNTKIAVGSTLSSYSNRYSGSDSFTNSIRTAFNKNVKVDGLSVSLNDIRRLAIDQTLMERMAKTDGSFAQFGLVMFGKASRAAYDYRPTYVGGIYKNISFTEVLQTSQSDSTTGQALGSYAGHGITGLNQSYIGHLSCDDYGILSFYVCIMPDIYYSQGLDKKWSLSTQEDLYLPERAKLGMIPILNKELYYAGNNSANQNGDNYLWAYQNPYDEYRYEPNKIKGKIADPTNLSFAPYTQARVFESLPHWGKEFGNASNVRKDYLAAGNEDAYTAQFKFNIRAVRQLPYQPVPASII